MPRGSQSHSLWDSQPSTSGTQHKRSARNHTETPPSQHLTRSRRKPAVVQESESEHDEIDETAYAAQDGAVDVDRNEFSETTLKWASRGLYDLPPAGIAPSNKKTEDSAPLVKLLLISHHGKQVMTNNKLRKSFKDHGNRDDFDSALPKARKLLLEDFGYILAEISPGEPIFALDSSQIDGDVLAVSDDETERALTQKSTTKQRKGAAVHYILVGTGSPQFSITNCLRTDGEDLRERDASAAAKMTMLTLALLYIFMEGGDVVTDSLWCFLKPFGFDSDMNHALVGKVKDLLINTFVKQQYIILQNKSSGSSVDQSYCKWGPRADLEFSRLQIVNLCAKIFGAEAQSFGERFHNAVMMEKRRTEKLKFLSKL